MIDLRSDTVTLPTAAMRKAAYEAEVGDDVYGEDPTVKRLEETAANILGKEAALFVTSGTQGNQIAALTHCKPGDEVIMEASAHIYLYEAGAFSALAGVQSRPIQGVKGAMDPAEVAAAIRAEDIHFPETTLICLENTHNKAGGTVIPLDNMKQIYEVAKKHHIPVHLDGARLFNASVASGIAVREYAKYTDTVQFCLSKGLGAPVGSIIAGDQAFIHKAKKWRKRLGGGLRQAGMIAGPGLVALTENVERLSDDHELAKKLADGINNIPNLKVENDVETNIILVNVEGTGLTVEQFLEQLKQIGVLAVPYGPTTIRFVTHLNISKKDIDEVLERLQAMVR
ncbi:low-specificity L-threonine aldolase [Aquibacillus koreensis]|uniref:Low-specificity L-threonine aldolase n=1 Tax=Aquibacillus koreensis TaxID=279446 RepID=A0A9X3WNH8_9BACI|nr:low-specificity L-threonine aldolase [Aquibacillus koreensis]MCT2536176.1 low-specificity L-threonine aldolase [Aquibacillus koreensis]MDC3422100.1 low-specificity L-threonine aldolase [Aquibacillus koreensis]